MDPKDGRRESIDAPEAVRSRCGDGSLLPEGAGGWRVESLIQLGCALFFCMAIGGLLNGLMPGDDWMAARFMVGTLTFHGAALLLVHAIVRESGGTWRGAFGLGRGRLDRVVLFGTVTALAALPMAWMLSWLSAEAMRWVFVEPSTQQAVRSLQASQGWAEWLGMGFMTVVVAPAAEEVLFRGVLYPRLRLRWGRGIAMAGTAVLFGLIHVNLMTFVPLALLGVVLAWLYETTGNLLTPVVAHSVFNLANLLLLFAT